MSDGYGFKICVIGDGAVGKTSLVYRYLGRPFSHEYIPTLGTDFVKGKKREPNPAAGITAALIAIPDPFFDRSYPSSSHCKAMLPSGRTGFLFLPKLPKSYTILFYHVMKDLANKCLQVQLQSMLPLEQIHSTNSGQAESNNVS